MKTITFITDKEGFFDFLRPPSTHNSRRQFHSRYSIKVERREDISFAIRMWFSLFGGNLQYSPFVNSRSRHLDPGYTYVVRGRDNAEGARFVRHRPDSRHRCRMDDPDPRRRYRDHHDPDDHDDFIRDIHCRRDFGPPDPPRSYVFQPQRAYYHDPSPPSPRISRPTRRQKDDSKYHDFERELRELRSRLDERSTFVPTPAPPPQFFRARDKSPVPSRSSSSSSSECTRQPAKSDKKRHEGSRSPREGRRVRFAHVDDYVEGMHDAPLPPRRPGNGYGRNNSRWEDRPCFDESRGEYGVVREPKTRYPGIFEI